MPSSKCANDVSQASPWLHQARCEHACAEVIHYSVHGSNRQVANHLKNAWTHLAEYHNASNPHQPAIVDGQSLATTLEIIAPHITNIAHRYAGPNWKTELESLLLPASSETPESDYLNRHLSLLKQVIEVLHRQEEQRSLKSLLQWLWQHGRLLFILMVVALATLYCGISLWRSTWNPRYWFATRFNDLLIVRWNQAWGEMQFNLSVAKAPISVGGVHYTSGIGTHATSELLVRPTRSARWLLGACGVDDEVGASGSIICRVTSFDKVLFQSEILRGGNPAQSFRIPIEGLSELQLRIDTAGDDGSSDHADWVNLSLE